MTRSAVFFLLAAISATALAPASVPAAEPTVASVAVSDGTSGPRLDVNRATLEELILVPGIGPAIAAAILEARERQGAFSSLEALLEVKGIGEKRLTEIRRHLEVLRPAAAGVAARTK